MEQAAIEFLNDASRLQAEPTAGIVYEANVLEEFADLAKRGTFVPWCASHGDLLKPVSAFLKSPRTPDYAFLLEERGGGEHVGR